MGRSDSLKKAQQKYQKEYQKKFEVIKTVKFNKNTDSDILNHLESVGAFTTYVKELIRKDIKEDEK